MIQARLLSAAPQSDGEHWDLAFRWQQDVWETDSYSQNPVPYQRNPQLGIPARPPYPWRPGTSPTAGYNFLYPYFTFGAALNTANSPPTIDIYGQPPVNAPAAGNAPQCPFEATVATTGGSIASGTYLIAISAGPNGPVSQYLINAVMPGGTTTGVITVSGVVWQAAAASVGVFVGTSSLTMHSITETASWTGSSADTYGNPTVFTITAIDSDGIGLPDPVFNSFLFQAKIIVHGGVWGENASSVGTSGGFGTATFDNASWSTNQWAGYTLVAYGWGSGLGGTHISWTVASNTATTLKFTGLSAPPTGVPLVMRAAATSITSNTIGDANFVSSFAPSGLTVNAEAGNLIRIISGTGAGQPLAVIESNTATVFTIAGSWAVTPDSTSVYIVEVAGWQYSLPTSSFATTGTFTSLAAIIGSIPVTNFQGLSVLVEAITLDVNGNWSVERYAPIRELFVPASKAANLGYILLTPIAGVVTIDLSLGSSFGLDLKSGSPPTFAPPVNTGGVIVAGDDFSLYLFQDGAGGRALPSFSNAAGGFVSNTGAQITIDGTASTETALGFTIKNGLWSLDSQMTGKSIT